MDKISELKIDKADLQRAKGCLKAIYRGQRIEGSTGDPTLDLLVVYIKKLHDKDTQCCTNRKKLLHANAVYNNCIAPIMKALAYMEHCGANREEGVQLSNLIHSTNSAELPARHNHNQVQDSLIFENEMAQGASQPHFSPSMGRIPRATLPQVVATTDMLENTPVTSYRYNIDDDGNFQLVGDY